MFLAIRMIIYVIAVPVAAMLGGSFDPGTGNLVINVDTLLAYASGGSLAAAATFVSSRVVKAWGGRT